MVSEVEEKGKQSMAIQAPKGTKDILPEQSGKWQYIEQFFREICKTYGFSEIRTPMFEHTELFVRGVGDTTDVVEKQMYSFQDLQGRDVTLKPEGTSPVVRALIENGLYAQMQPTKLYYITPCFRYENTQKGRYRQFHQLGIEVFGAENPLADAEIVSLAANLFQKLNLTEIELQVNSVGCPNCRPKHREALKDFLRDKYDNLCEDCKGRYERNPMRILDCKKKGCQEQVKDAPLMLDYLCEDCALHFQTFQKILQTMGIKFTVNPWIVRGLDYYTKTAFEFVSTRKLAQGTVCGGGRYDNLAEEIGGPHIPGVGFGLGIERLLFMLEEEGVSLPEQSETDYVVIAMGEEACYFAIALTERLRKNGRSVQMDMMGRNVKNQFKYADKIGGKKAIIIGDQELADQLLQIKDMETGEQKEIPFSEIEKL